MERIETANELMAAARKKRSVVCKRYLAGYTPAALVLNMQFAIVVRMLTEGLFIYEPKGKKPNVFTELRRRKEKNTNGPKTSHPEENR